MNKFMITITWTQPPDDEFNALVPAELAKVEEHEKAGIRGETFVAADMSKVWTIYMAQTEADVQEALQTLPLHKFMRTEITPLQ